MALFDLFSKKPTSHRLPLVVDIHSHLLPGLDDGVKSLEETAFILRLFQKMGYRKVITTPHIFPGHYPNTQEKIMNRFHETREYLDDQHIDIKLEAAAEYFLDDVLMERILSQDKLMTFDDNYLLFETSFINKPAFLEEAVFNMNAHGYQPVLAHPERYFYLQEDPALVQRLRDMNVLFQLNLLSLFGFYSRQVRKFAFTLLRLKMIDFIGSDCHSAHHANEIFKNLNAKNLKLLNSWNFIKNPLLSL